MILTILSIASQTSKPNALCTVFGPSKPLILAAHDSHGILGLPAQRLLEIEFRSRRNYLETFLPSMDSRIASPGGWSKASWIVRRIQPEEWKGHGEITVVGLCIFNALLSADQKGPEEFNPIIFCDNADFVIAAREELNLPILLVDVKEKVIGARYQMKLERSGHTVMEIQANLAAVHRNGEAGKETSGESWVSMSLLKPEIAEAVLPGLANVIGRLQGLDMKNPTITQSNLAS